MKIYVAGKFEERVKLRKIMQEFRDLGHEITHDWTYDTTEGLNEEETQQYLRDASQRDKVGVQRADLLFLYTNPKGGAHMTELGIAMALSVPCVIYKVKDAANNIFYNNHWCDVYEDLNEAYKRVEYYAGKLRFVQKSLAEAT